MTTQDSLPRLSPRGAELLVSLCRYIHQNYAVSRSARYAAAVLLELFDNGDPVQRDGAEQARLQRAVEALTDREVKS